MGAWEQLRLLLYKNFLLRTRQPVILALEVLWPITIFLIVLSVRHIIPPINQPTCYYNARAQPSAGALPFLQSLICNIDNECLNRTSYEEIPTYPQARVNELVEQMSPLMADNQITDLVRALPKGVKLMQAFSNILLQPEIQKVLAFEIQKCPEMSDNTTAKNKRNAISLETTIEILECLENGIPVKDLLKDEDKVREILVEKANITSKEVADAILNSRIQIPKLMEMIGSSNKLTSTVCDPSVLKQYLISDNETSLEEASKALCKLDSSTLPTLIDHLQQEVDGRKIMKMVSELMSSFGRPDVSQLLEDLGNMWDTIFSLKSLPFDTTGLNRMSAWFPHVKAIYKSIRDKHVDLFLLTNIAKDLEPLYENKEFGNEIKEMIKYFNTIAKWIKKGLNIISEVHSVLGSLFKNTTQIEEKLKDTFNPRAIRSLLSIPVSSELKQHFKQLKTSKKIYTSICKDPGLVNLIYPNNTNETELNEMTRFQDALCSLSLNGSAVEFVDLFSFKDITTEAVSFSEFINNTASVFNTFGLLSRELAGSSHNYAGIIQKLIDAIVSLFVPSSSDDVIRIIDGIGVTMDLIQEIHEKARTHSAFNVIYNLLNHSVEITNLDREASLKYGILPYWPYLVETFFYTLADEQKWEKVLNLNNWPEIFCNLTTFSSTFTVKDIDPDPLQEFSCKLFQRHLDVIKNLKDSTNKKPIKWKTLIKKSAAIINQKQNGKKVHHYKWKRLISAYRSFNRFLWREKDLNKRMSFITLILNGIGQYMELAKVPYWQDMLAIFYSSDHTIHLLNQQMKAILDDNSIKVPHLSLNLPTLTNLITIIIPAIPDVLVATGNVITKDLKHVAERIEKLPYPFHEIPCERGSLTDIIKFKDEAKIRNIEQSACIYGPLIPQEVLTESTISSILIAIQNVSRGKRIEFNWTEAGQHLVHFIYNTKQFINFNGTVFPDVPKFSEKKMKIAINEVKDMFETVQKKKNLFQFSSQVLDSAVILGKKLASDGNNKTLFHQSAFCQKSKCVNEIGTSKNDFISIFKYILKTVGIIAKRFGDIVNQISGSKEIYLKDVLNNTVVENVLNLLMEMPDILQLSVEAVINPHFPDKISKLFRTNISTFCLDDSMFMETFGTSEDTATISKSFHSKICHLIKGYKGFDSLLSGNVLGLIPELTNMWNNSTYDDTSSIQFSQIVDDIIAIVEGVEKLHKENPKFMIGLEDTILNPFKWEDLGGVIIGRLQQFGSKKFTLILQHASGPLQVADKQTNHTLSYELGIASVYLRKINKLLQNAIDLSLSETNNTSLADIFSSVPELEEIMKWSENYLMTGIETLLHTVYSDNQKILNLLLEGKFWEKICNNSVTVYFTPLPDTDVKVLEEGKIKFCNIDWTNISKLHQNELINVAPEAKVKHFLIQFGSVLDGIQNLAIHHQIGPINSPLFSSIAWTKVVQRPLLNLNKTNFKESKKVIVPVIQKLLNRGDVITLKTINNIIPSLTYALKSVHGGITWKNLPVLYSNNKRILAVLNIVNNSINLFEILLSTIQNPNKLSAIAESFIYSTGRKVKFCSVNESDWNQYFELPLKTNNVLSSIQYLICDDTNGRILESEFFTKMQKNKNDSFPINNTMLAEHIYDLGETFVNIWIPPTESNQTGSNLFSLPWADINAWRSVLHKYFDKIPTFKPDIDSIPVWMSIVGKALEQIQPLKPILNTVNNIVSVYRNKAKVLNDRNSSVFYLHEIFPHSPHFQKLLKLMLPFLPELIETLIWTSISPQGVPIISQHSEIQMKLCDGSLRNYLYNPSLNDTQWERLSNIICKQNYTAISIELKENLGIETINNTEAIDWKKFGENLLDAIKLSINLIDRQISIKPENWNQEITWINTFKNMTSKINNPAILIYLPLGRIISSIPIAYMSACDYKYNNPVYEVMCNLSQNKDTWAIANQKLSDLLIDVFDNKDVSWKDFYLVFMNISQLQPILQTLTNGELNWNIMENDIFNYLHDSKTGNFTWKESLEMITALLNAVGMNSSRIEEILPTMPYTQKFVQALLPVLPETLTTFLWTIQVPDKFMKWINDSKRNLTKAFSLLCTGPATKYLYNPAFADEDWQRLLYPLCSNNYNYIASELEKEFSNKQVQTHSLSWNTLGLDIVQLINLMEEMITSNNMDYHWITTIQNFTLLLHKPEIKAYLTLHWPFSRFCSHNYILNFSGLPSYTNSNNMSEFQLFLCEMSKEKFANDIVSKFQRLVSLTRDNNRGKPTSWEDFYSTAIDMIQVKKLLHALLGNNLFNVIEKVENNLLAILKKASPDIWKDPDMWKEVISMIDNIYSAGNFTLDNLNEYHSGVNVIVSHLETLLKSFDNQTMNENIRYILVEVDHLQSFAGLISYLSRDAVQTLHSLLKEKDQFQSLQDLKDMFCDYQKLSSSLELNLSVTYNAQGFLCNNIVPKLWMEVLNKFDRKELEIKLGELITSDSNSQKLNYTSLYANVYVLVETANYFMTSGMLYNSETKALVKSELDQKLKKIHNGIEEKMETAIVALSSLMDEMVDITSAIKGKLIGEDILRSVYFTHWYIRYILDKRLNKGDVPLQMLIKNVTILRNRGKDFNFSNEQIVPDLLSGKVKYNKLSELSEKNFTYLFCDVNFSDWITFPSNINTSILKENLCSQIGKKFLNELKAELVEGKRTDLEKIYLTNKTSAEDFDVLVYEVHELIATMSYLSRNPAFMEKDVQLLNITKLEMSFQKYSNEQRAVTAHRFTSILFLIIRAVDGLTGQQFIHTIGRNLSPFAIVSTGKFINTVLKGSVYEAMTSSQVWERLVKEMFPVLPDVAFARVHMASEYFSEHPDHLKILCNSSTNKHQLLTSVDSIMNIYCHQPPKQWTEKIFTRVHPAFPTHIVDSVHLLMSANYTIKYLYDDWTAPKLYGILENIILTLVDRFAASPSGFYNGEKKYWEPILNAIKFLVPSLFNSLNNRACSYHRVTNAHSVTATLMNQLITKMPRVETLVCTYSQFNLSTFYQEVSQNLDLKMIIKMVYQLKTGKISDINCMTAFKPIGNSVSVLQQMLADIIPYSKFHHLRECARNAKNGTFVNSIQKYATLIKHVLSLMQEFGNSTKSILESPQNVWQFIQDFFTPQMPAFTRIEDVITDLNVINETLQNTPFNLSLDAISALMNSSINLNLLVQKNFSQNAIKEILCLKNHMTRILSSHPLDNMEEQLNYTLCQKGGFEVIIREFDKARIALKLPVLQKEYFLSGKWLEKLAANAQSILNHLFNLIDAGSKITSGFAADLFSALANVISENTVEKLLSSLQGLINILEPVLEDSPMIEDLKVILKGIQGLKSLQGLSLFNVKYRVQDLFSNASALKEMLKNDLSIDDDAVKAIVNANLDLTSLLASGSSLSAKDVFCNPKELGKLLNFENESVPIREISKVLCNISASQAFKASTMLLRELALSRIIGNFAKLGIDGVLEIAGLNWNEALNAFEIIKTAPSVIPKIKNYISKLTESLDPEFKEHLMQLNVSTDGIGILGTPQALKASGKILCGKPLRALQDEFKLLEVSHSEPQLDQREFKELPSEFCQHGYGQVMKMLGGPILWGFFKPILRGKILFAPDNIKTRLIIEELNSTFDSIAKFIDTLHAWGEGTIGLQNLQKHEDILEKVKNLLQSDAVRPLISQVVGNDASNILEGLDISSLKSQVSNVGGLLDLVQLVGNMSQCFELSRFVGYKNEKELERAASELNERREFIAAIIFLNMGNNKRKRNIEDQNTLPSHIQYKLRMDIDNIPSTRKIRDKFWRPGPRDDFLDELRYFRGFIQLQELIDQAITIVQTNNDVKIIASSYMQQFPYPCYEKDEFGHFLKATLPVIMTVAWIFLIAFLVRERVLERELHLEEIMRVMGLRPWVGWTAWFMSGLIILTAINVCIVLILKVGGILSNSSWIILLLFFMAFAVAVLMFCYFISAFFNTATIAALTGIIIYLLSFLPFILIITLESEIPHWGKLLSCLMVSTSFCYGCVYITRYEDQGIGLQWKDIWKSPDPRDDMSFGLSLLMVLASSTMYFILGWYISNVWPANQARKQPWYFFVLPRYWNWNKGKKTQKFPVDFSDTLNASTLLGKELKMSPMDETISGTTGQTGISLSNLHVIYNKNKSKERIAVAGLTLDLFEGHITTLLGQNGAGKTTTINVLTGQYPPTFGTAFVYGRMIPEEFSEIQKLLGYCPQYNTLFDRMTVREHLKFYACLKGILCGKKLEQDIDEMLHSMGLWSQQKEQACYLSGGMQRRLCVALAFIGGSKLIILDEPTSSVDPVARRNIWDLIMKYRHGRTILLTTHHMDEADILSDRVAIIHRGKLLCSGSPLLLKSKFGCGYQLTLSRQGTDIDRDSDSGRASSACSEGEAGFDTDGLLNFIQNIIPTATLMEDHGSEVIVSLPQRSHDGMVYNFCDFFTRLDSNLSQLGFGTYGLSSTTLEEVFLTLCHLEDTKLQFSTSPPILHPVSLPKPVISRSVSDIDKYSFKSSKSSLLSDLSISNDPWSTQNLNLGGNYQLTGTRLKLQQLSALLMKRCYHTLHDWKAIVSSILLPCIFIAIAMGFALIKPAATPEPALLLNPTMYRPQYVSFVGSHGPNILPLELNLLENFETYGIGMTCSKDFSERYGINCNIHNNITALPSASHMQLPDCVCKDSKECRISNFKSGRVPCITTANNDIIFNLTGMNVNDYILNSYMDFIERRYGGWTFANSSNSTEVKIWFENTGYHSAPSYLNTISNAVLRANMKLQGADPSQFGITVYNHPLHLTSEQLGRDTIVHRAAEIGIALVFLLGFAFVPSSFIVYVVRERTQEEKRLQYVGGVGPVLYWSSALLWDMLLVIITVALSAGIIAAFSLPVYVTRYNLPAVLLLLFLFGWATTPLMYLLEKLFQEASIAFMVLYCINIFIGLNIMVALLVLSLFSKDGGTIQLVGILKYIAMAFPQYVVVGGLFELARNHIQADIFAMFGQDTYKNPFNVDLLGQYYLAMAIEGIIFFLINLLLEFQWLKCKIKKRYVRRNSRNVEDSDVLEERKRVHGETNKHDVLKLVNLTQIFRSMAGQNCAVDNLCLSIPKGECFGLLGVNGAGKTTLFRILTGQLRPTSGNAFIKNMSVSTVLSTSSQLLGYCPQADALDDLLTPEQHLAVYARLRGIPSDEITGVIYRALEKFQLKMYADRKVGTLSRGTKRKVCTAISMLGNPQIILLDEPTTGMDPVTRRLVWSNVQQAIKDQRSVVLTSHSMEECDVLCSRLAIMVNGKLQCLGSPQYLKYKFGTGYTITLRVADGITDWGAIVNFIHENFPSAVLRAHHYNMVEFSLPSKDILLSEIFGNLEKHSTELGILDVSVNQTTLDQVFVSFARQQTDGILEDELPLEAETIINHDLPSAYNNIMYEELKGICPPSIELNAFTNNVFIEDETLTISSFSTSCAKSSTFNMYEADQDYEATKF